MPIMYSTLLYVCMYDWWIGGLVDAYAQKQASAGRLDRPAQQFSQSHKIAAKERFN